MAGRTPAASPDHWQAQLITEASRFYSQFTKWDDRFSGTAPFRVEHLVYRPVPFAAEITHWPSRFVVDITDTIDRKIEAVTCYRSQFEGRRAESVAHYLRGMAAAEGAFAGYSYGEMYALPRPIGVQDMVRMLEAWQFPPPFDPASPPRSPGKGESQKSKGETE